MCQPQAYVFESIKPSAGLGYLAPAISQMLPVSPAVFMQAVGVVEIIAGLIDAFYPIVGGWVVAPWLWAIIVNLLLVPGY